MCCSPWDCKELDRTERLSNNQRKWLAGINGIAVITDGLRQTSTREKEKRTKTILVCLKF